MSSFSPAIVMTTGFFPSAGAVGFTCGFCGSTSELPGACSRTYSGFNRPGTYDIFWSGSIGLGIGGIAGASFFGGAFGSITSTRFLPIFIIISAKPWANAAVFPFSIVITRYGGAFELPVPLADRGSSP